MLKIAICDDNLLQRSITQGMIEEYAGERGLDFDICCYENGEDLLRVSETVQFNIYFLDMLMPGINGMDVAHELRRRKDDGLIIFLTVDPSFAAESYKVDALYYIVKPLERSELDAAMGRAMMQIPEKSLDFRLKTSDGYVLIRHNELMYAEAVNRAPVFHLTRGRVVKGLIMRGSFSEFTKGILASRHFAYLGPSKLINLRFVEKMDDDSVLLSDGTIVYGSKAGCAAFHISWEEFLMHRPSA